MNDSTVPINTSCNNTSNSIIDSINAISNIILCITFIVLGVIYKLSNRTQERLQLEKIKIMRENSSEIDTEAHE